MDSALIEKLLLEDAKPAELEHVFIQLLQNRADRDDVQMKMLQILVPRVQFVNYYLILAAETADHEVIDMLLHHGAIAVTYAQQELQRYAATMQDKLLPETEYNIRQSHILLQSISPTIQEQVYALTRERMSHHVDEKLLRTVANNLTNTSGNWKDDVSNISIAYSRQYFLM